MLSFFMLSSQKFLAHTPLLTPHTPLYCSAGGPSGVIPTDEIGRSSRRGIPNQAHQYEQLPAGAVDAIRLRKHLGGIRRRGDGTGGNAGVAVAPIARCDQHVDTAHVAAVI